MSYRNPGRTPIVDYTAGLRAFQESFNTYAGQIKQIKDLQEKEQKEIDDANAMLARGKNSLIEAAFKQSESIGNATKQLADDIIADIGPGGFAGLTGAEKENTLSQFRLIKQAAEGLNYDPDNPTNSGELIELFGKLRREEIQWEADNENKTLKLGDYSIGQIQQMINMANDVKEDEDLVLDTKKQMAGYVQRIIKNQRENGLPITDEFIEQATLNAADMFVNSDNKSWAYVWQNEMRNQDKQIPGFDASDYRYNEYDIDDADVRDAYRTNRSLIIKNFMIEQMKYEPGMYNLYKPKPKTGTGESGSGSGASNEEQGLDLARQYYKEFVDVPDNTQIQDFTNVDVSIGQGMSGKISSAVKRGDNLILEIMVGTGKERQTIQSRYKIGGTTFQQLLPNLINDRIKKASVSMGIKSPAYLHSKNIYEEFYPTYTPLELQYDFGDMPGVSESFE